MQTMNKVVTPTNLTKMEDVTVDTSFESSNVDCILGINKNIDIDDDDGMKSKCCDSVGKFVSTQLYTCSDYDYQSYSDKKDLGIQTFEHNSDTILKERCVESSAIHDNEIIEWTVDTCEVCTENIEERKIKSENIVDPADNIDDSLESDCHEMILDRCKQELIDITDFENHYQHRENVTDNHNNIDIDAEDVIPDCQLEYKSSEEEDGELKEYYDIRDVHPIIGTDTEVSNDDDSGVEEINLSDAVRIFGTITKEIDPNSSYSTKIKKGRIVENGNVKELEYMLPADLEEKLLNIRISENDKMELCGTIVHKIEDTQTVTMRAAKANPILNIGTIVLDSSRNMIGLIDNIFGSPAEPYYLIFCKDSDTVNGLTRGDEIFCAPQVANAYFTAAEKLFEPRPTEIEEEVQFSDDAAEAEFLGQTSEQKVTKKKKPKKRKMPVNQRPAFGPRVNFNPFQFGGFNNQMCQPSPNYFAMSNPFVIRVPYVQPIPFGLPNRPNHYGRPDARFIPRNTSFRF